MKLFGLPEGKGTLLQYLLEVNFIYQSRAVFVFYVHFGKHLLFQR